MHEIAMVDHFIFRSFISLCIVVVVPESALCFRQDYFYGMHSTCRENGIFIQIIHIERKMRANRTLQ